MSSPDLAEAHVAVVIPSYGKEHLTRAVVRRLAADGQAQTTVVVDNSGSYGRVAGEVVLSPGSNLGWLRGTNLGLQHALHDRSVTHLCLMNNDVTLAPGFLRGLVEACSPGVGLVAPSYDDVVPAQTAYYTGPAERFRPEAVETESDVVDGTCILAPREALLEVGLLDERRFGRWGWGGSDDLCVRMRAAGYRVVVTRRAYLQHMGQQTAAAVHGQYTRRAAAEMTLGMRRKYGRNWTRHFPSGIYDDLVGAVNYARHVKVLTQAGLERRWGAVSST